MPMSNPTSPRGYVDAPPQPVAYGAPNAYGAAMDMSAPHHIYNAHPAVAGPGMPTSANMGSPTSMPQAGARGGLMPPVMPPAGPNAPQLFAVNGAAMHGAAAMTRTMGMVGMACGHGGHMRGGSMPHVMASSTPMAMGVLAPPGGPAVAMQPGFIQRSMPPMPPPTILAGAPAMRNYPAPGSQGAPRVPAGGYLAAQLPPSNGALPPQASRRRLLAHVPTASAHLCCDVPIRPLDEPTIIPESHLPPCLPRAPHRR